MDKKNEMDRLKQERAAERERKKEEKMKENEREKKRKRKVNKKSRNRNCMKSLVQTYLFPFLSLAMGKILTGIKILQMKIQLLRKRMTL